MLFTGLSIFLGLVLVFLKLPRRTMLRVLRHDLLLDVGVTLLTLCIHWGSFEGVMAATLAGLITSIASTLAKKCFGYIKGQHYVPGLIALSV
jgi:hypothetical protein